MRLPWTPKARPVSQPIPPERQVLYEVYSQMRLICDCVSTQASAPGATARPHIEDAEQLVATMGPPEQITFEDMVAAVNKWFRTSEYGKYWWRAEDPSEVY